MPPMNRWFVFFCVCVDLTLLLQNMFATMLLTKVKQIFIQKIIRHYARHITPKRVASAGVHLPSSIWTTQLRRNVAAVTYRCDATSSIAGLELNQGRSDAMAVFSTTKP